MSVHSWLAFAKETGLEALVSSQHKTSSNLETTPIASNNTTIPEAAAVGVARTPKKKAQQRSGPVRGSNAAPPTLDHEKSLGLDKEEKSCLEMLFYTATGGASLISDEADAEAASSFPVVATEEDKACLLKSVRKGGGGGAGSSSSVGTKQSKKPSLSKKIPSAIALHHSKHDMSRVEFALALMALARYKQRHTKRNKRRTTTNTTAPSSPVTADNRRAGSGGRVASTGTTAAGDAFANYNLAPPQQQQQQQQQQQLPAFEPNSCEEFMHVLEDQILNPLDLRAKRFIGDRFREEVRFFALILISLSGCRRLLQSDTRNNVVGNGFRCHLSLLQASKLAHFLFDL